MVVKFWVKEKTKIAWWQLRYSTNITRFRTTSEVCFFVANRSSRTTIFVSTSHSTLAHKFHSPSGKCHVWVYVLSKQQWKLPKPPVIFALFCLSWERIWFCTSKRDSGLCYAALAFEASGAKNSTRHSNHSHRRGKHLILKWPNVSPALLKIPPWFGCLADKVLSNPRIIQYHHLYILYIYMRWTLSSGWAKHSTQDKGASMEWLRCDTTPHSTPCDRHVPSMPSTGSQQPWWFHAWAAAEGEGWVWKVLHQEIQVYATGRLNPTNNRTPFRSFFSLWLHHRIF